LHNDQSEIGGGRHFMFKLSDTGITKLAAVAAMAGLLSACAKDVWDKPGGTQTQFNVDDAQCQMFAMGVPQVQPAYVPPTYTSTTTATGTYMGGPGYGTVNGTATTTTTPDNTGQTFANLGAALGNAARQKQAMRACMMSKGYTLEQNR
jgi:hypothetical protein